MSIDNKNIAILYSPGISNSFVISSLEKKYGRLYKIAEIHSPSDILKRTIKRKNDPYISKINKLAFFTYYYIFLAHRVNSFLSRSLDYPENPIPDIEVGNINAQEAIDSVKKLDPNIILVSATGILGKKWLDLNIPIINVHTGIVPRYRGRFCWFWPVVEGKHDLIGVSAHMISNKVDSGKVISQKFVPRDQLDYNYTIENINYRLTPLLFECLENAVDIITGSMSEQEYPPNDASFKAYLEPGITDYIRFTRNSYKSYLYE
jgi:hypothetical protein